MKQIVLLLSVLVMIIAGCSGSQTGNNELSVMMNNGSADAWINIMPNTENTFFVTGSIDIQNYGDSTISSIRILKCLVYQNNEVVYNLIPDLKDSLGSALSVGPGQSKKGVFTSKGVELKSEFNPAKTVSLTLFLISSNQTKQVVIQGVKVTKVL